MNTASADMQVVKRLIRVAGTKRRMQEVVTTRRRMEAAAKQKGDKIGN